MNGVSVSTGQHYTAWGKKIGESHIKLLPLVLTSEASALVLPM